MKFAHMSDCHLGCWRDSVLREAGLKCFERAIDICINEEVEFVLISGDLFESSRPPMDVMEIAVAKIKEARDKGIRVYVIEGSHDFSPTGKTMTRVLEKTGLFTRVAEATRTADDKLRLKFTEDKTGIKITGLIGRWGALERTFYESLDRESLLKEGGFKILVFHTGLEEVKAKEEEKAKFMPISLLPKGFDYYAGGHIHRRIEHDWEGFGKIAYPGSLFPTDFRELETLRIGGFYIVTKNGEELKTEWKKLDLYQIVTVQVNADGKSPEKLESEIRKKLEDEDVEEKIVLLRVEGRLSVGKPSDVDFRKLTQSLYTKGALLVKRNISKLSTREYEEIRVTASSREELEDKLIKEHAGQQKLRGLDRSAQIELTKTIMEVLVREQKLGEHKKDYIETMKNEVVSALGLEKEWKAAE